MAKSAEEKRAYQREYQAKNKEVLKARRAAYYADNSYRLLEDQKARRQSNPDTYIKGHLKLKYGITEQDYDVLYTKADGKCEICSTPIKHIRDEGTRSEKANVDHCHTTGRVRGMLCNPCNIRLPFVEAFGARAQQYLGAPHG